MTPQRTPPTEPDTTPLSTRRQSASNLFDLPSVCWRQWNAERKLRRRGIDFRTCDAASALRAYAAMSLEEFAAINGRQAWSNVRTIARSLDGLLPDRPLTAIDLGSGIGQSTEILASFLPRGSCIVGIEFAGSLVDVAQRRLPPDRNGVAVAFVVGSVCETYRDCDGRPIDTGRIDLVNASGIVGHHLSRRDAETAAREISRVLRPGGIAALDVGPELNAPTLADVMHHAGFDVVRRTRSNLFDRTGQVVFRRCENGKGPPMTDTATA